MGISESSLALDLMFTITLQSVFMLAALMLSETQV